MQLNSITSRFVLNRMPYNSHVQMRVQFVRRQCEYNLDYFKNELQTLSSILMGMRNLETAEF